MWPLRAGGGLAAPLVQSLLRLPAHTAPSGTHVMPSTHSRRHRAVYALCRLVSLPFRRAAAGMERRSSEVVQARATGLG